MNLQERIHAWLQEPDSSYVDGLLLYEQAGGRGIVLRTLQLGEDAYNRTRLQNELQAKLTTQPNNLHPIAPDIGTVVKENLVAVAISPLLGVEERFIHKTKLELDYGATDSGVYVVQTTTGEILKQTAYDLMNERSELKARIYAVKDDPTQQASRRDWAFRILDITDQIDEIYSRLDFLQEYGYLPPTEEPKPELDDTALLMNVRTYVSKYKGKLRRGNLTAEQADTYRKLLQQYQDEKARLELKLKRDEI